MEKEKKRQKVVLCFLLSLLIVIFYGAIIYAEQKTWRLRWAYFATSDLPESKPMAEMAKRIAERTNGSVQVEIYWSDSLVPIFEILDAVRTGAAELGTWPIGAFSTLEKSFAFAEVPLLYESFKAQVAAQERLLPLLTEICESKFNQKVLAMHPLFPLEVGSAKKPIKRLEDWKGLLVQTINPQMSAMVHAFGAKATPISPTEVFEALQKGVVDATIQSVGKYTEAKLWEVCPYLTVACLMPAALATSINKKALASLPKEYQTVLLEEAKRMEQERTKVSLDTYENYHLKILREKMKECYFLPYAERQRWKEAVSEYVTRLFKELGAFGEKVKTIAEEVNRKYPYEYR